jgi:hypothetical protein
MIVFPLIRSVGLKAATASSSAATLPMFVRSRPSRTRWTTAPAHSGASELSGWYLSYVYDPVRDGSDLVVIDASDFRGKPVARVQLPQRVPYGFHGNWIAG